MLYRMRVYQAVRDNLPVFHDFFRTRLLPVQLRHGARLVGRWETEDGRVVAIWEYDDRAACERIEAAVRADPDSGKAQRHRAQLPALMTATEEVFMHSAVGHSRRVEIRHGGDSPSVAPDAWIAPTAVLSGRVRVGSGSCVLHGAVLTDDGGPVDVGANCVIMEHAVVRGTPRHPVSVGDHVLAGPHCYLTGCTIGDEVFIATGAMVFNGAQLGRASSVAIGGAVHIGCVVPPQARIPIGWVAVGDPARLYPPNEADSIRAGLEEAGGFMPFVFGADPTAGRGQQMRTAMRRYARSLSRSHRDDENAQQPKRQT